MNMLKVKIKALKRAVHDDLIKEYENPILHACDILLGTEFISINGEMPEGYSNSEGARLMDIPNTEEVRDANGQKPC